MRIFQYLVAGGVFQLSQGLTCELQKQTRTTSPACGAGFCPTTQQHVMDCSRVVLGLKDWDICALADGRISGPGYGSKLENGENHSLGCTICGPCKVNKCHCQYGTAAIGAACTADSANICSTCELGYYKSGDTCKKNKCDCPGGVGSIGALCPKNGTTHCASCNAGLHQQGNVCTMNGCYCPHGSAVTGSQCTENGLESCRACWAGYRLVDDFTKMTCQPNVCRCASGVEAKGTACTDHDVEICSECNDGFHLAEQKCRRNVCNCHGGDPAQGSACLTDGLNHCASCHSGFYLDGINCLRNKSCDTVQCTKAGHSVLKGRECAEGKFCDEEHCCAPTCEVFNGTDLCPAGTALISNAKTMHCGFERNDGVCRASECCAESTPTTGCIGTPELGVWDQSPCGTRGISTCKDGCMWRVFELFKAPATVCPSASHYRLTEEHCREFAASHPGLRYLRTENFQDVPMGCLETLDGNDRGIIFNKYDGESEILSPHESVALVCEKRQKFCQSVHYGKCLGPERENCYHNTDEKGHDCGWYYNAPRQCGWFNTTTFNARRDCCACGGGNSPSTCAGNFTGTCDAGTHFVKHPDTVTCKGDHCEKEECCAPNPTCVASFKTFEITGSLPENRTSVNLCPSNTNYNNSGTCANGKCHLYECCNVSCYRSSECENGTCVQIPRKNLWPYYACRPGNSCPITATDLPENRESNGDCRTQLASGQTCTPICKHGFVVSGDTACVNGKLVKTTCVSISTEVSACGPNGHCAPNQTCYAPEGKDIGVCYDKANTNILATIRILVTEFGEGRRQLLSLFNNQVAQSLTEVIRKTKIFPKIINHFTANLSDDNFNLAEFSSLIGIELQSHKSDDNGYHYDAVFTESKFISAHRKAKIWNWLMSLTSGDYEFAGYHIHISDPNIIEGSEPVAGESDPIDNVPVIEELHEYLEPITGESGLVEDLEVPGIDLGEPELEFSGKETHSVSGSSSHLPRLLMFLLSFILIC